MNNFENNNQQASEETCPCCPRHCPLTATSCEKGAAYAAMSPEERAAGRESHSHGSHDEPGSYPHGGNWQHNHGDGYGRGHGHHGGRGHGHSDNVYGNDHHAHDRSFGHGSLDGENNN